MFDTYITIVGTALQTPEPKKLEKSGAVVASFRVISNARRFDKENQVWVDGANLRIKVNCWRRLVDGVVGSVSSGDPVIVYGRIATREWQNEQGETRFSYEVDAETVGHDLSRGRASFRRLKADIAGPVVEDDDSDSRVNGEVVGDIDAGTRGAEDLGYGESYDMSDFPDSELEAMNILRSAGLDPAARDRAAADGEPSDGEAGVADPAAGDDEGDFTGADPGSGGPGSRGRRRGRQPVPA